MSAVSDRYRRCAVCQFPNLAHLDSCERCKGELTDPPAAALGDDLVAQGPSTVNEGLLAGASVMAGLAVGGLVFLVLGLMTRGELVAYVAQEFTRPTGKGSAPILICAGVFVLYLLASKFILIGNDPWFDGKQVKVGVLSTALTTFAFALGSIGWAGVVGRTSYTWQNSFLILPFLCQFAAMTGAIVVWSKLDEIYGSSSDYDDLPEWSDTV